jgi:hypothetical protein
MVRLANLEIKTIRQGAHQAIKIFDGTGLDGVLAGHHFLLNQHMMVHRIESMLMTLNSIAGGQSTIGFTNTGSAPQAMFLKHRHSMPK